MGLPAFQSVIDEHSAALHRYLVGAVGVHDANDCFQETMIAALRAYPALRHGDNLGGWLFTIAHRKVIDAARAKDRRPLPVGALADGSGGAHELPDVFDDGLWARVSALPAKQRSAVLLRFVADRPYADIADALDCSEAAARQNVRAGLQRLREELG
jgi:RNA polymerase sigma factor (sigma-70 family)